MRNFSAFGSACYYFSLIPVEGVKMFKNETIVGVLPDILIKTVKTLKFHTHTQFKVLASVSGVDYPEAKRRFEVVYEFVSLVYNKRLRIKTGLSDSCFIFSLTEVFPAASWWEREIWDLFGVFFADHPDLRRILTDYGFEGHPLQKCFPLNGYVEAYYSEFKQRVVCVPTKQLSQEFKNFEFFNPWFDFA